MTQAYSLDGVSYSDESIVVLPAFGVALQTEYQTCGRNGTEKWPLSFELISEPDVIVELTGVEMRSDKGVYTAHGAHGAVARYDNKRHTVFWFNELGCADLVGTQLELMNVRVNEQPVANIHVWVRHTHIEHLDLMPIPDGIPH